MSWDDFDITFCTGEVHFEQNGVEATMVCPVKNKCYRFWTEEHSKEALRHNIKYHSFFFLTDPNILTDAGCENFWDKNV